MVILGTTEVCTLLKAGCKSFVCRSIGRNDTIAIFLPTINWVSSCNAVVFRSRSAMDIVRMPRERHIYVSKHIHNVIGW